MAGKATIVHHKDMRTAMINLCTRTREVAMRPQIVALFSLGIRDLTHVFLSRASIGFIDGYFPDKKTTKTKRCTALWERAQLCTRRHFNGSSVSFHSLLAQPFNIICFSGSVIPDDKRLRCCRESGLLERQDGLQQSGHISRVRV